MMHSERSGALVYENTGDLGQLQTEPHLGASRHRHA